MGEIDYAELERSTYHNPEISPESLGRIFLTAVKFHSPENEVRIPSQKELSDIIIKSIDSAPKSIFEALHVKYLPGSQHIYETHIMYSAARCSGIIGFERFLIDKIQAANLLRYYGRNHEEEVEWAEKAVKERYEQRTTSP